MEGKSGSHYYIRRNPIYMKEWRKENDGKITWHSLVVSNNFLWDCLLERIISDYSAIYTHEAMRYVPCVYACA